MNEQAGQTGHALFLLGPLEAAPLLSAPQHNVEAAVPPARAVLTAVPLLTGAEHFALSWRV